MAAVVTYYAGPALGSKVFGAMIGAAAGSVASQGVLIVGGEQSGFDWKGVALAAAGGAITAGLASPAVSQGLSEVGITSAWGQAAVRAAVGNVATQGLGNALGVQEGFDWKSVAISAVSAGAGSYAGDKIADFGAARSWSADTIRNVTVFGATAASGSISAAMRGNLSSQVLLNVGLDALASTMGYAITDAAAAKTAEKNASVGSVERQAIPLETRDVVVDDIAMDIGGAVMTSGLAVGRSVRSMASPASASLVEAAVGLSDHINSPSEERYVDEVVRRAHEAGLEPPDTRSYPMVRAYAENGYVNPGGRGRVAAYGDPVGMASNRDVDRLVRDGQGWGVLANAAIEGSALRLGGISEYRAPSPVTWMGTGSAAAWRDMKTAQSNYHLGPVAAPIGYLGGAAKSLFEMGEFVFGAGKTLAGTMAYVSSFGAMGGEDFAASARVVRNIGGLAGNLLGGAAYLQSGGQVGEQQYAASLVYAGAARQGAEGFWDASHGAWGRGEYMQSGASVGVLFGLPIPLDEGVQLARAVNALEDVVDAARVAESVANTQRVASAAAPGARVSIGGVEATEIAGRLTPTQMAGLQREAGTEFAQIYLTGPGRNGGGGSYYLIQGAEGGVNIPIGPNVRWINHTHPEYLNGSLVPLRASGPDRNVLRLLQESGSPQLRTQVVPQEAQPFYFWRKNQ
ncbi:hypothetical protein [Lysobacter gummosus]|uniref:Uncharacterized protein n=1 Tax=Lysobacter gummosus TaxID=262324 RepID=A0ABY3X5Y4_9GAMM|nr:hypothetical protein [Lysobacter gummosus]UNP27977.1 hypothetical protein MOV92_15910 [Lysobacter gummosus]